MLRLVGSERAAYVRGEEVVVALEGVEVLDFARARIMRTTETPPWSIATVAGTVEQAGERRYALFFRHGDAECVCIVGGESIEGTA